MPKKRHSTLESSLARMNFDLSKRSRFYRDMASFTSEGITGVDAMEKMLKVASRRKGLSYMATILSDVIGRLKGGSLSIGEALAPWVPGPESSMISAGESSGLLVESFKELAWNTGAQARVLALLRGKVFKTGVLIVAAIVLAYYVLAIAVPQATQLLTPEIVDRLVIAPHYISIGNFIVSNAFIIAGLLLAAGVAAALSLARWTGQHRTSVSRWLPPWSLYSWTQGSFFLASMSSMLGAGLTFKQAIEMTIPSSSPWQKWHLRRMRKALDSGKGEVEAMDTGMLPDPVMDQVSIYASLPSFPKVMAAASRDSILMYEEKVTLIAKTLEFLVIITLAVFIVITVVSIGEIAFAVEDVARRAGTARGI